MEYVYAKIAFKDMIVIKKAGDNKIKSKIFRYFCKNVSQINILNK